MARRPHALNTIAPPLGLDALEPTSFITTFKHRAWNNAMNKEFTSLMQNGTYTLVPPKPKMNLVSCKWVFKIKRWADDSLDKAYLVVKNYHR